jgi:hypothetical protein
VIAMGDKKELIVLIRKPRSKYYRLACFGRRAHYRVDGTCKHTDELLASVKPELRHRVKVDGWGGKDPRP